MNVVLSATLHSPLSLIKTLYTVKILKNLSNHLRPALPASPPSLLLLPLLHLPLLSSSRLSSYSQLFLDSEETGDWRLVQTINTRTKY